MTDYGRIIISSGHSRFVRGAAGVLEEVTEARRVVERVASLLRDRDVEVTTFHDNESETQDQNLSTIVNFHNARERDLDISVHFNAYVETHNPMGTECLYYSDGTLAANISAAIASCGFIDRGPKQRQDLYFLRNTEEKAILIEVCFVDSGADAEVYVDQFDSVCEAIAGVLTGRIEISPPERPPDLPECPQRPPGVDIISGSCSWFGGPNDQGVSPSEGLAFIYSVDMAPGLFLDHQPPGTTGLARRLDPDEYYIAMRWDYDEISKDDLLHTMCIVRSPATHRAFWARPADWGPNENTGRICDISPGLMSALGVETDDELEIVVIPPRATS